jgi:internalin A
MSCLQDELQRLPHVGEERHPKEWVKVRTELNKFWLPDSWKPFSKKHEKKPYLSREEFLAVCKICDLAKEHKALNVAKTLHILGSVLYFHENIHLQNLVILDKHWATEAVYLALLDKEVTKKMGKFDYKDLQRIWKDKYKLETHGALVELMLNFKIAYRVKNTEHTYIAPLLLKENPSAEVAQLFPAQGQYTRFEYHYTKFMPKGLMARLIIEKNRQIYQDLQWRTGVVLEFHGCLVEATEHRYGSTNKMAFRIKGAEAGKALAVIYDAFKEIHGEFPNLEFEEMIPCCCVECRQDTKPHFFKHSYLQKAKTKLKTVNCEKSLEFVEVLQLLEGYEHETGRQGWEERINRGDFESFFSPENEAKMQDEDKPLFNQLRDEFIFGRYGFDFVQKVKVLMRKNGF